MTYFLSLSLGIILPLASANSDTNQICTPSETRQESSQPHHTTRVCTIHDIVIGSWRAVLRSLSGDGHARPVHEPLFHEHLEHRRDAAHPLKVLHHVLAAGLEVGHEGHLVGNLFQTREGARQKGPEKREGKGWGGWGWARSSKMEQIT